jgi:hypothetical protein
MQAAGFRLALYPFNTVAAIVEAVGALWGKLKDDGEISQSPERLAKLRRSVQDLIGMDVYWNLENGAVAAAPKPKATS